MGVNGYDLVIGYRLFYIYFFSVTKKDTMRFLLFGNSSELENFVY
jgi:hypothetical protein